jgi:hypothetical protein
MSKLDLKARLIKAHPTVQINLNMIRRLLFSLIVNSSVMNQLAKLIHDSCLDGVSIAQTSFLLPKKM